MKFKFKFSGAVKALLIVASGLTLFCAGYNVYNLIALKDLQTINVLGYVLLVAINLLITVACIFALIHSVYKIKNGFLRTQFGLIGTKIQLAQITEIIHFIKAQKLVIYFDKNKYSVIIIDQNEYADFVSELTKANCEITYSVRGDEEAK